MISGQRAVCSLFLSQPKKIVALGFQLQVVVTGWLICGENCRSGNSIQTLSSTNSGTVLCCIMLHCIVLYYVALCCVVQGSLLQQQDAQALTRPRSFCISNDKQDRTQFLTMWLHLNLIWLIVSRQAGKHCTPLSFEAPKSWL